MSDEVLVTRLGARLSFSTCRYTCLMMDVEMKL